MPRLHIVKPKKSGSGKSRATVKSQTKSGSAPEKHGSTKLKPTKPQDRRKDALKRLGVTEDQLAETPDITSLLKQSQGGLKQVLQAMRFSADLIVRAFLEKYDLIPERDRECVPWEAIALAANIDTTRLLGSAILSLQAYSANAVKIIALSSHPRITASRVKYAMEPGGDKDRTALDTALGFLPTTKGSTFIINPIAKPGIGEGDGTPAPPSPELLENDLEHLFPSLMRTQDALVPEAARMLEAGR
ncbi:MAG TPA: hypothetical protein VK638_28635 [Edaphobacter sp.]|nr:hypothetical protein [Edaphobacter sp.]